MKVFLIGDAGRQAQRLTSLLGAGFEVVALPREAASTDRFDGDIGPGDAVITMKFARGGAPAPRFALLHVPGAGLDGIDFGSLHPATAVCNVFEHEGPIAEYVMWAALSHELRPERMSFTARTWSDVYRKRAPHGELAGKTIGIFGFGRIGRAIAIRARAFGMRVATLDRSLGDGATLVDLRIPRDDLTTLLRESDYFALCAPLSDETRGRFGSKELAAMKPGAVLINVSRAELVDETALYAALSDGHLGGAVLDVWYRYPTGADDVVAPSTLPLLDLPNVIATAHSSAWTEALPARRYRIIADNLGRLRDRVPLVNQVRAASTPSTGIPT